MSDKYLFKELFEFIRHCYPDTEHVPLHVPTLGETEKKALSQCIDSTYVSSIGPMVTAFEQQLCAVNQCDFAIATVNGTAALHLCLVCIDIKPNDEVITQPMTFVATANAIDYCGAHPVFIDINPNTLGLCPNALRTWLESNTRVTHGRCINKTTGRTIRACIGMHTFGHPIQLAEIKRVCDEFSLTLVEDAAEALGSHYQQHAVGTYGTCGALSFNGNKIITAGGGGALLTNHPELATKARHLATTAKLDHPWEYHHDQVAYNYRMPNLNAALGCAQIERLESILTTKRKLAQDYQHFFLQDHFISAGISCINEPDDCQSNYWLNTVLCHNKTQRDQLLSESKAQLIEMRPVWQLLSDGPVYQQAQKGDLTVASGLANRLVNLPSSISGLSGALKTCAL